MTSAPDHAYFPKDYDEAKRLFRKSAARISSSVANAESHAFEVPSRSHQGLAVDSLYVPARSDKKRLLVFVSGVHGVECFAGDAIQRMFLDELAPRFCDDALNDTGFLIFHCMNPFGFKSCRRATENNVNLNRNFASSSDLFRIENPGYERMRKLLEPKGKVRSPNLSSVRTAGGILAKVLTRPSQRQAIVQAIAQGQFQYPEGLEFGGSKLEPQTDYFMSSVRNHARGYEEVVVFDIHTGLGDRYELHIIPDPDPDLGGEGQKRAVGPSLDPALFERLFHIGEDRDIYQFTSTSAKGFYRTYGGLTECIPHLLERGTACVAVTLEYGTIGNGSASKLKTLTRLVTENQGFLWGYAGAAAEVAVREGMIDFFAPGERRWRANSVLRARELFTRLLKRMAV